MSQVLLPGVQGVIDLEATAGLEEGPGDTHVAGEESGEATGMRDGMPHDGRTAHVGPGEPLDGILSAHADHAPATNAPRQNTYAVGAGTLDAEAIDADAFDTEAIDADAFDAEA